MKKIQFLSSLFFIFFIQTLMADFNVNTAQNSSNGDSITVYENSNDIYVSTQNSGSWVTAVPIGSSTQFPTLPRPAINTSNQMVVVWVAYDPTFTPSLYASYYNGSSWVTYLISNPALEYVLGDHQVKIADNGQIVVTWVSFVYATGTNEARAIYVSFGTSFPWPAPATI